jgi:hypothetical protein
VALNPATKRAAQWLGRDAAIALAAAILFALVLAGRSDRGQAALTWMNHLSREIGPPLAQMLTEAVASSERVMGFAVAAAAREIALSLVARRLATSRSVMSTREIAEVLRDAGYDFPGPRRHETETRAWLESEGCFRETRRGTWVLGSYATD